MQQHLFDYLCQREPTLRLVMDMEFLSVRLFARQQQAQHRRALTLRLLLECAGAVALNLPAAMLTQLEMRLRLPASVGLLALNVCFLAWCFASNTRRFFAAACAQPVPLRPAARCIGFRVLVFFLLRLMATAAFLPTAGLLWFAWHSVQTGISRRELGILLAGAVGMAAVSLACFLRLAGLLFLAPYLHAAGVSAAQSLRESMRVMKTHRQTLRRFRAGFFGWFLSCALLVPIPFVWGYYQQSAAVLATWLMQEKNAPESS